jgi:hypothetical protein
MMFPQHQPPPAWAATATSGTGGSGIARVAASNAGEGGAMMFPQHQPPPAWAATATSGTGGCEMREVDGVMTGCPQHHPAPGRDAPTPSPGGGIRPIAIRPPFDPAPNHYPKFRACQGTAEAGNSIPVPAHVLAEPGARERFEWSGEASLFTCAFTSNLSKLSTLLACVASSASARYSSAIVRFDLG